MLYALELSRIHSTLNKPGGLSSDQFRKVLRRGTKKRAQGPQNGVPTMAELVEKLFQDCPGLPRGHPSYVVETHIPMIQDAYNRLYPGKYRIIVFDEFGRYQPCYKGPPAEHDICIVHCGSRDDGTAHFDGVRCVNTLFGKSYYCPECETAFSHKVAHSGKCVRKCRGCGGFGPEFPCRGGLRIECSSCNGVFCCTFHRTEQPCYIQPVEPKAKEQPYRIVAYDFECSQHTRPDPDREWYLHEVNFVCAQVTCSQCIANDNWKDLSRRDCKICGGLKEVMWSAAEGKNPLSEFVNWILHSFDKSFHTYAFHITVWGKQVRMGVNPITGGRYDMRLVLSEILRMGGLEPEVVRTGHKLYEAKVEKRGAVVPTYFRDSYCLMSQPLGDLVDAYKLGIEEKQYFPHLYNKPSNYKRRLRHLPKRKYYAPETMKPEKRKAFKEWYRENKNKHFYLPDKLREYCCNDVQILLHALVAFRREWMEVCQDDVLRNSMTIASACMRTFRIHHLQPETLSLSPEHGYERHDRQSVVALKYLKWYAKSRGVSVRHRDSPGGEYKLECKDADGKSRHFMLDGYVERPGQRPLAIEFHGCAYHGCSKCYRDDTVCANGKTAKLNREQTEAREAIIRQHMDLHVVWECEVTQMLKERCQCKCNECDKCSGSDKCECSMKQFFDEALPWGPIDPRDAYFGGRTGPTKLRAKPGQGRQLSYFDIQSLYPATNFYTEYPLGVPNVIVKGEPVNWSCPDDVEYKGLYKVLVLPPTDLRHPVLPAKFDDRLLFPLCRTCAIDYEKKSTRVDGYRCTHTDAQRSFACTVTHLELMEALRRGYKVKYFDRAWHWERWSADVFKPYVRQFMKLKIEASGYPDDVATDAQKQRFIEENERVYGIKLDPNSIRKNKAKRQIAKLCLNRSCKRSGKHLFDYFGLWGRFSMRNNLAKTVITTKPDVFCDIAYDDRLVLNTVEMVSEEAVHLTYAHKKDFVEEAPSSNIFVSLFMTSAARLRLYEYMRQVTDHPQSELLYTDTDSIIYEHPVGDKPVEVSKYLGQMSNEYPNHAILEYYSGGAKQYVRKLNSNENGKISHLLKLRGITLNYKAKKSISFRKFKQQVLQ
ncbi:hypothetical protein AAVH_35036 [Aphelenchoides avenae]|nr:hypothetical protein AAVH_35036 [Aphelenchus avenae]